MQMAGLRDALAEGPALRVPVAFDHRDRVDVPGQGRDGQHPGEPAADDERGASAIGVLCHPCLAPLVGPSGRRTPARPRPPAARAPGPFAAPGSRITGGRAGFSVRDERVNGLPSPAGRMCGALPPGPVRTGSAPTAHAPRAPCEAFPPRVTALADIPS
ncbi:hypothetical protein Stsp01_62840 [Streptomyces sp. NBRC 13847]|nr:hypothetical protein Stsp01_62840 [Streptomyces sp. NBRC 13847]